MPRFGIVLLPHQPRDAEIVDYAQELCALAPKTHHTLNMVDRRAHATLLHADGNESDAYRWWTSAQAHLPTSISLELYGLNIHPPHPQESEQESEDGGVSLFLSIHSTPQLRAIYDEVYRLATDCHLQPAGYFVDRFIPHFTLGAVDALPDRRLPLPLRCTAGTLPTHPALVEIRDRGSVRRILTT